MSTRTGFAIATGILTGITLAIWPHWTAILTGILAGAFGVAYFLTKAVVHYWNR